MVTQHNRAEMPLPEFPVDDVTLDLLEHALGASYLMIDGEPQVIGAEFSLTKLLDFLSGYGPERLVPLVDEDGYTVPTWFEVTGGPLYHPADVIRALIAEVRRLRGTDG